MPVTLHELRRVGKPQDARVATSMRSNEVTKPLMIGNEPFVSTGEWRPVSARLVTCITRLGEVLLSFATQTVSPTVTSFAFLRLEQQVAPTGK